jgi:cytochrome c553
MKRFVVVVVAGVFVPSSATRGQGWGEGAAAFVKEHCVQCHGAEVQKAGLRLDTLGTDLADEATLGKWVRVHDQISAGKMPPPSKRGLPPRTQVETLTKLLRAHLHEASLARQQAKGRVLVRRLNTTEYENTIRELVGTKVRVKELLPEENSVAGFDNVSSALDLSATHLLLLQEAAEKAVLSAVPMHPHYPITERRTGKEMTERGPNFKQTLGRSCRLEGDSLIVYSKLPRYGLITSGHVAGAGTYRVRVSVSAVGAEKKPFPVGFFILENTGRDDPVLFDVKDVPHGLPQVIEFDVELGRRQAFVLNLLTHWDIRDFKRPIEEHTGPGLRFDWLELEGPIGPFPPASYTKLFGDVPLKARSVAKAEREGGKTPTNIKTRKAPENWFFDPLEPASVDPRADAEKLIRAFLPKALRGPAPEHLAKFYVQRVHQKLDEKYSFFDAMTYGYKSILSSPHFLLFAEPGQSSASDGANLRSTKLDDYAIANRLAYFLWSGPPDDVLLKAAANGELANPEVLRAQVERLLEHPKARRFTENFTGQWLDLRHINATIPDPRLYGDFDGILHWSMPRESYLVFEEILKHDRSLLEFVDADWSIVNERLAKHYGIPGPVGIGFEKVKLPANSHRGGVLTQASVLKVTADGTRTSPVLRGKWVLEKILGQPPAPPPADVPSIEPDIRGATTIRQQLDKHRAIASCASCHVHIDPPGFALEAFDPIGGYREFYRATVGERNKILKVTFSGRPLFRGPNVEMDGVTHDGKAFRNIDEYKKVLLAGHKEQIARNLTEKMLVYATGAEIQFADRAVVEQILQRLQTKNYGFRTLVHEVVQSRVFLHK